MSAKFSETVERPLRMLLQQEFVESGRAIPASRTFDACEIVPDIPTALRVGSDRIPAPADCSRLVRDAHCPELPAGEEGAVFPARIPRRE